MIEHKEFPSSFRKTKLYVIELDGVGPVDNRPSTDKLHHVVQKKEKKKKEEKNDT